MRKSQLLVSALLLVLLLLSCAPKATPAPAPQAPAPVAAPAPVSSPATKPAVPLASARPAWQVEWDRVVQEAKREGIVTWANSVGASVRRELTVAFNKNGYGLRIETIDAGAGTLIAKILAERRAGLYLWDVLVGGASAQPVMFKPAGATSPLEPALILPDLTDPEVIKKVWYGGKLPWIDRDHHLIGPLLYIGVDMAINTNLVKPGEIKAWDDVLNPKWKGKIVLMDPTVPGTNVDGSLMPMFYEVKGEDWLRKLAAQEPMIIENDRLAHEWLTQGKYSILMPVRAAMLVDFRKAGAPIAALFPEDATMLTAGPSTISFVDRAPHPNAAKIFINWYLSKEAVTIVSREREGQSARVDVPTDFLPPEAIRKQGYKYWIKDREEVAAKVVDYRAKSKEIFGRLLK